jgi:hypothetical protein
MHQGDMRLSSMNDDTSLCPRKKESVRWIHKQGVTVLLDPRIGRCYRLNATASLVWDYCDGVHDLGMIVRAMQSHFGGKNRCGIEKDARKILQDLIQKKLVRS